MLSPASFLVAFAASLPQAPSDWPQYRGPQRLGSVAATQWLAEGREKPLWSAKVGRGYSCPSIVGRHLVTMGFNATASEDRIVCLDRLTGAEIWAFAFASKDKPEYHGGGTLTTPAIHAGLVYCLNRAGKFHVLDLANGKLVWSRDYREELELKETFHGYCASPLIEGDRMLLQFGGMLAAVRTKDGALLWKTEDHGDGSYCNPARIEVADKAAVVTVLGPKLVVIDIATGHELHTYPWKIRGGAVHCATPLVIGDRVFVSTAYGKGCAMLRLGKAGPAELVWTNRRMRNKVTACIRHGDHLYGFDESMLRCMGLDGNATWRVRGLGLGSMAIAGDRMLILNSDGELIVAEVSPVEFRELSRSKVLDGGEYWTMPVLKDGLIYVRNSLGDLVCLDHRIATGTAVTAREVEVGPVPTPTSLFARHRAKVGGTALTTGKALRLRGKWSVALRGLDAGAMTWTMAADKWDLRLDSEHLAYAFDGVRAWAIEPQGARLIAGEELFEISHLFPRDWFAPVCPDGAVTRSQPVRFDERTCWKVTAPIAKGKGKLAYYFDQESGRLAGSDGPGLSTIAMRGDFRIGSMILPASVTRFRAEDGQKHVLRFESAEWAEVTKEMFAPMAEVKRLMRTPAEIARDTAALRERFASALGQYKLAGERPGERDDEIRLVIRNGDLMFVTPGPEFRIRVEDEKNNMFPVVGDSLHVSLVVNDKGRVSALSLRMDGASDDPVTARRVSK